MKRAPLLFLNVFVIATCGLIYELLAGTLSSYVLGDSVTQFSIIIGIYLFAMGVGSWLSRFIDKHIADKFVEIELGGGGGRRIFGTAAVSDICSPFVFQHRALRRGFCDRRSGRARNSAADADT